MTDRLEEQVEALTERVLALETALHHELDMNLGPEFEPPENPKMTLCDECGIMFAVDVENGMTCPWCGTTQDYQTEAKA